jgi:ATP-dependent RNA circularization protein (DNA/RNA ligase family)
MIKYHKIHNVFTRDKKIVNLWDYSKTAFRYLEDAEWELTEKVDGTNIRVCFNEDGSVEYGGRTDNAQIPVNLLAHLHDAFDGADNKPTGLTLFGEGYGNKIQKIGGKYQADQRFILFDVWAGYRWMERNEVNGIADSLGIPSVPVVKTCTLKEAVEMVMDGVKSQWGDFLCEGLVARPMMELNDAIGSRVITKIKHRDLYRHEEGRWW